MAEDNVGTAANGRSERKPKGEAVTFSRETLEKIRARDADALGQLFDRHFRRLYNLALRLLGSREAAEDAIQEVFLRVYQKADQLDAGRDPGPWLTTITLNACRAQWRSPRYRMQVQARSLDADPALSESLAAGAPGTEAETLRAEQRQMLHRALMQLPESQREIVLLHDYEDLGHDEIAKLQGMSHAAVRKRYSRALEKLRELLKDRLP